MNYRARQVVQGLVQMCFSVLTLPLIVAFALSDHWLKRVADPFESVIQDWVDSAPDRKED